MSDKSKRLIVNNKLLDHILTKKFNGVKKDMAAFIKVDIKTLDTWLADRREIGKRETGNHSALERAADLLNLPLAALCMGTPNEKEGFSENALAHRLGGFMGKVADMVGKQLGPLVRCVHWGNVLVDDERWYRTTWVWDYKPPTAPSYQLLELTYQGPSVDAMLTFQKDFGPVGLLIDYGIVKHVDGEVSAFETITRRGVRKALPQKTKSLEFVTYYDAWPHGFVARANRDVQIEEKGMMDEKEVERRLSDPGDPLVGFCRSIVHEEPKQDRGK
jgi:hypothetical protein